MPPPYQDKWRDGRVVRKGRRDCRRRYEPVRDALQARLGSGFTVADVGGNDGYFARRLAADLDAKVTVIDRGDYDDDLDRLRMSVTASTVTRIGSYDAILAMSVLHHMSDWRAVYDALKARCTWLVVEPSHPGERDVHALKGSGVAAEIQPVIAKDAVEVLCKAPRVGGKKDVRSTFLVRGDRDG